MSGITILETLLIGPLKLVFEIIYMVAYRVLGSHPGLAIVALSLIMNIMVLPLYRRADAMQEKARDIEAKLHDGVAHIKKYFSGDERMMILQTYYRQNNYKPTDALNGSVSLLLEVPFFIAAYQFLSNLKMLDNVAFGPIANLGAPDGLLVIGGVAINVLPVLMTLINVISSAIYLKGFPLKTKIQLYGMAGFFLVFLYTSPSGLVFYWTLNNLFSLVKTIFYKIRNAKKTGIILLFAAGIAAVIFGLLFYHPLSMKRKLFVIGMGVILMLPMLWQPVKTRVNVPGAWIFAHSDKNVFLAGSVFLTGLLGMLIPSTYIAASPLEYVDPTYYHDPLRYILMATCLAAGTFLVWMRVFYWLASPRGKAVFGKLIWVLCGIMLMNYMFFGTNLGVVNANLQFVNGMEFTAREELLNLFCIAALFLVMIVVIRKWERIAVPVLLTAAIAIGSMSALNMVAIRKETSDVESVYQHYDASIPNFQLSKEGKNVVVIMLDRAPGFLMPYLFQEKPELQEQFDGFVDYENTMSHGPFTIFGAPALYGGYEYTPVEMNKRDTELLVDKHNEALKVLPVLFSQNGYQTTVVNPVYANYRWIPDVSIFKEYPEIDAWITEGLFVDDYMKQQSIEANYRNFFCFSIVKSMPVIFQKTLYYGGNYNRAETDNSLTQTLHSASVAEGISSGFEKEYAVLRNMAVMTEITDGADNHFLFLSNAAPHEPALLQTPEYVPAEQVDNTQYDAAHAERFTVDGVTLNTQATNQMSHYHANMAAMLQLGAWFDYLRENDAYDNTRIILVADHGCGQAMLDELMIDTGLGYVYDGSYLNPLLLVKDFNSHGFSISDEFMTNADVPTLAVEGLIQNPVNPFTGVPIDSSEKYAHEQYATRSEKWSTSYQTGAMYLPDVWVSVKDDLRDADNWAFSDEKVALQENALP